MPYPSTAHQVSPKMSLSSLFRIHSWLWQWLIMAHMLNRIKIKIFNSGLNSTYSAQRGSSMQSVLMQCLAGSGEVRAESVVHMGKQGSGDQSPVTSFASSSLPEILFSYYLSLWTPHLKDSCVYQPNQEAHIFYVIMQKGRCS